MEEMKISLPPPCERCIDLAFRLDSFLKTLDGYFSSYRLFVAFALLDPFEVMDHIQALDTTNQAFSHSIEEMETLVIELLQTVEQQNILEDEHHE